MHLGLTVFVNADKVKWLTKPRMRCAVKKNKARKQKCEPKMRVAIIGSGLIGRAWAVVFAKAGHQVMMYDTNPACREGLADAVNAECDILYRHGLLADIDAVRARVTVTETLADAVQTADFIQENGPERLEIKQALFAELDKLAPPDTPIASSTSAIPASNFTDALTGRHRCFVGHPVNPPHLVPLVEICGASWTSAEIIDKAYDLYASCGMVPVRIKTEKQGFVLNRLQGAVLAEALRLLAEDVISVEDLDKTMKDGLGMRWAFMGPFETIDLNAPEGVTDYFRRYCGLFRDMAAVPPGPGVFDEAITSAITQNWQTKLDKHDILPRTSWRNERLASLAAWKKRQAETEN